MGKVCSRQPVNGELVKTTAGSRVLLHIYNVGTSGRGETLNWFLNPLGTGAFHCGVEVYDWEWSFSDIDGMLVRQMHLSGVFCSRPKRCEGHTYRGSEDMGRTGLSEVEVLRLIGLLERQWLAITYDLLRRNCCHFCEELCKRLGVGALPPSVLTLAGAGAAVEKGRDEVLNVKCCRAIAGETALFCKQREEPNEAEGDADVHYLM